MYIVTVYIDILFRFSPEEKEERNPLCYMPFGWGPRNCVGMRFALMEAKMALANILRKYKFHTAPDTEVYLTYMYVLLLHYVFRFH